MSRLIRITLLGALLGALGCSAPAGMDAGTDAIAGPDIGTACTSYCQTFSSQCAGPASQCQTSCLCRASSYPACTAVIANYVDCASRTALLSCTSGDALSTICDDQRTARDNCLATAMAADAGSACVGDAATDSGTADAFVAMGSCQTFCDRQAAAGCPSFDASGCLSTCQMIVNRPSNCASQVDAFLVCYSNADYHCDSSGQPITTQCSAEQSALIGCH